MELLDEMHIKNVVVNLVDNAIAAMREKGTIWIDVRHDSEEESVRLEVGATHPTNGGFRRATGGADALRQLEQEVPDLVLTDLMMPDLDGWQVMALKSGQLDAAVPGPPRRAEPPRLRHQDRLDRVLRSARSVRGEP